MDSYVEENCRMAIESENKTKHFENLIEKLKTEPSLAQAVWEFDYFPLVIIQTFTDAFFVLNTKNFTSEDSHEVKVCMDLILLLISNESVKNSFLECHLSHYFLPFLIAGPDNALRVATLKVLCAILEDGNIDRLNSSELLPILLRSVDSGSEEQQVLCLQALSCVFSGRGLDYAVQTIDRFQAIDVVLCPLITRSIYNKKNDVLKMLIEIYIKLCEKPNVRQKIREKLPDGIDSKEILNLCFDDESLSEARMKFLSLVQQK